MERLVLTAQVAREDSGYVARLAQLFLEGTGDSLQEAQDELIQALRSWIETHDGQDDLEQVLAQAGFPGVEEDTELQLEFGE
jgi:predicted RNase H-like HicB family nuclease